MIAKSRFAHSQRMLIVSGILCIVIILVVLQMWLFTATMSAFLNGDESVLIPAALVSLICLSLNVGLFRYLYRLER